MMFSRSSKSSKTNSVLSSSNRTPVSAAVLPIRHSNDQLLNAINSAASSSKTGTKTTESNEPLAKSGVQQQKSRNDVQVSSICLSFESTRSQNLSHRAYNNCIHLSSFSKRALTLQKWRWKNTTQQLVAISLGFQQPWIVSRYIRYLGRSLMQRRLTAHPRGKAIQM